MTDPRPLIPKASKIKNAVFRAAAVNGDPVGYREIMRELGNNMNPESLSRWLRSMCLEPKSGIIKRGPGQYTVARIQFDNALGRFS